ncbi:MAG TPA: hypothetical protein VFH23_03685 [Jiangellaceae bacterium]|nr:hypothetical protein [Jiangellaceae bacterium]
MIRGVAGGEPFHRPWPRIVRVADGCGLRNELLELTGLRTGLVLGAALDEDPLARHGIGGDHPVAGLAGRGRVDAGAVLELSERLLAVAGHDR